MTKRLIAVIVALAAFLPSPVIAADKPNLVFIFIDDLGYGDIGPFGSKLNRTPHLDRMATEGMRLTSFYAAPVCTPSRAQVLTGCYAKRVSLPNVIGPNAAVGLSAKEHTIAELLKRQDYATMCIGKWHVGDHANFLPTRHGFDHYLGLPYSNDMIRKGFVPLIRDDKVIEEVTPEGQDKLTERYTEEAVKFIRDNKDRPFFLYFPHTAVHTPIHPGKAFQGKSKNGRFGDWVEEVDWSVGQVLDTLRQLKLDRNTLVLFSTDNGPWLVKGKDGGTAGPLRGGKGSTWEGGVRVPTIAWWPGKVPAGSACDAVAGNVDILPTFVKLGGGSLPADRKIDGVDLWPLLSGESKQQVREAWHYFKGSRLEAVRSGPWKLALSGQGGGMGKGVARETASPAVRLYNLDTDIGETTDVAAKEPEVVKRLQGLAAAMDKDLGATQSGPGVREPGRVAGGAMTLPSTRPAVSLASIKVGDAINVDAAPQVGKAPLTIACDVKADSRDGVIVAHGGASVGYALYLKDGNVVFAIRTARNELTSITASPMPAGQFNLEARLASGGAMTLLIDGKPVATGKAPGLLPSQPMEDLCVGFDNRVPVAPYPANTTFKGTITNVKVSTQTN